MPMQLSSMFLVSSLTWLQSFFAVSLVQVQSPGTPPVQAENPIFSHGISHQHDERSGGLGESSGYCSRGSF
ncbi:hypothetical protein EV2_025410 [Malus domestica]